MKRPRLILILLAVILLGCVAFLFIGPKEPLYHGKTPSAWLWELNDRLRGGTNHSGQEVDIHGMGTNAVPTLLRFAGANHGKPVSKLIELVNGQKLFHIHARAEEDKHFLANLGFMLLGTNAAPAVPELLKLARHSNPGVRLTALNGLEYVAPESEAVRTIMTGSLNDTDPFVQNLAAEFIFVHHPDDVERLRLQDRFPFLSNRVPGTLPDFWQGGSNVTVVVLTNLPALK
jgi:hypothetical protein